MKKFSLIFAIGGLVASLAGCSGSAEINRLKAERDSLIHEINVQEAALANYSNAMETITSALDSIAEQESTIFLGSGDNGLGTRDEVRDNLKRFENIMQTQKERIAELERELEQSQADNTVTKQLLQHLKAQIELKDKQIAELLKQVDDQSISIASLQEMVEKQRLHIATQERTINQLSVRNERQEQALATQDAMLNNGYVLIGTKDDLKRKGVLNRKELVIEGALDRSKFQKVDIRKFTEIEIEGRRPRVITQNPESSYRITKLGDQKWLLKVTNPTTFWGITNYLVIRTD